MTRRRKDCEIGKIIMQTTYRQKLSKYIKITNIDDMKQIILCLNKGCPLKQRIHKRMKISISRFYWDYINDINWVFRAAYVPPSISLSGTHFSKISEWLQWSQEETFLQLSAGIWHQLHWLKSKSIKVEKTRTRQWPCQWCRSSLSIHKNLGHKKTKMVKLYPVTQWGCTKTLKKV